MKVEIWSDIMCPFCYIGKRKFEAALAEFEGRESVEIEWKSFQLNPGLVTDPNANAISHLAESKGKSIEWAKQASEYVTQLAAGVGLEYHFEKAVVANSFNAHRLLHLSKQAGLGTVTKERLLKAYFKLGENIDDAATLAQIGAEVGLDAEKVKAMLASDQFADDVAQDILVAQHIGVQGVPFFVFDRKFAVSGAQEPAFFLKTMRKAAEQ